MKFDPYTFYAFLSMILFILFRFLNKGTLASDLVVRGPSAGDARGRSQSRDTHHRYNDNDIDGDVLYHNKWLFDPYIE